MSCSQEDKSPSMNVPLRPSSPQVTIRGQLFPHEGGVGKSMFVIAANGAQEGSASGALIGSVEELSLAHYRQHGFDQGTPTGPASDVAASFS